MHRSRSGPSRAPDGARSETVGTAAAVRPTSTGTPPGGSSRTLEIGTGIVSKERIQTSGAGSLQVMFNDKSTLTVGPNSNLVIDEFVYNPNAGGGRFAASLTKGALRFVGGQISHTAGATINTPVASLGIRGGAALVTHDAACAQKKTGTSAKGCTRIVCTGGVCNVKSRIDSRTVQLRVNQAVEVGSLGAVRFNVSSVTLNNVAKGGNGAIVVGREAGKAAQFSAQSTVDQTILEQKLRNHPHPLPPWDFRSRLGGLTRVVVVEACNVTDFPYTSDLLPAAKTIAGTDGVSDTVTIEVVAGGLTVDLSGWTFATWTPGEPDNDLVIIDGSDRTEPLTITGSDQDDFITGGTGVDEIDGGAGNDTADYSYRTEAVVVTLNGATGATVSVGRVDEDTIRNIENIVGGSAGDHADGRCRRRRLHRWRRRRHGRRRRRQRLGGSTRGKTDAVILTLNGAADATASVGGVDEDTVRNIENVDGGSAGDTLTGDDNDNVLDGGLGADTLDGGAGNDTITYDGLDLSIAGGADTDTLLVKAAAVIDLSVIADQSDIRRHGGGHRLRERRRQRLFRCGDADRERRRQRADRRRGGRHHRRRPWRRHARRRGGHHL